MKQFHPIADIFPLLQGVEFDEFCQDIARNGLLEPIWLHPNGQIIDGRNRYRACQKVGIEPAYKTWNEKGSLVDFVISLNLHRRHLTSSQRATLAVDILPMLEKEAKERQLSTLKQNADVEKVPLRKEDKGKSRDQAATLLNTNSRYVSDAKKLKQEAPKVFEQVKTGELTLKKAKAKVKDSKHKEKDNWTESERERQELVLSGISVTANQQTDISLIGWAKEKGLYVPIDRGTIWGNPFKVDEDGSRKEILRKYEFYYFMKPSLWEKLNSLKGKVLGCWCYPEKCHGDILINFSHFSHNHPEESFGFGHPILDNFDDNDRFDEYDTYGTEWRYFLADDKMLSQDEYESVTDIPELEWSVAHKREKINDNK